MSHIRQTAFVGCKWKIFCFIVIYCYFIVAESFIIITKIVLFVWIILFENYLICNITLYRDITKKEKKKDRRKEINLLSSVVCIYAGGFYFNIFYIKSLLRLSNLLLPFSSGTPVNCHSWILNDWREYNLGDILQPMLY